MTTSVSAVQASTAQELLECEARYWLQRGFSSPAKIAELRELMFKKRSQAAIDKLVDEMRRQWSLQAQKA